MIGKQGGDRPQFRASAEDHSDLAAHGGLYQQSEMQMAQGWQAGHQ